MIIFLIYSPFHYMRAWIRVSVAMNVRPCGEKVHTALLLQSSGLVRTVEQCAQRRVASVQRDTFSNERHEALCISRGTLSTKPSLEQSESLGLFFVISVNIIVR
jgi:hypothetical protein